MTRPARGSMTVSLGRVRPPRGPQHPFARRRRQGPGTLVVRPRALEIPPGEPAGEARLPLRHRRCAAPRQQRPRASHRRLQSLVRISTDGRLPGRRQRRRHCRRLEVRPRNLPPPRLCCSHGDGAPLAGAARRRSPSLRRSSLPAARRSIRFTFASRRAWRSACHLQR